MTATELFSRFGPYLGRVLEDEYIQEQLGQAVTGLRRSSRRVKGRSSREALKDRRLRSQLRGTVNSLLAVISALQEKPAKRRRVRLLPMLLLASAAVAVALAWWRKSVDKDWTTGGDDG